MNKNKKSKRQEKHVEGQHMTNGSLERSSNIFITPLNDGNV